MGFWGPLMFKKHCFKALFKLSPSSLRDTANYISWQSSSLTKTRSFLLSGELWDLQVRNNKKVYIQDTGHWVAVQLLSHLWLFATPWTAARQASLSKPTPGACSNSCPSSQWSYQPTGYFLRPLPSSDPCIDAPAGPQHSLACWGHHFHKPWEAWTLLPRCSQLFSSIWHLSFSIS